ncbi:MAG: helix-turn-helix transcriptional regulator [Bacillaceae bacterium]|mgnify:CR=1 FL=1|nr:helix-turn-helix transcriptional regulator [Bacillaceae bacterium]
MISIKLEELLKREKMTMYQLSKITGVRPNTVSQWVNNDKLDEDKRVKSISTETLERICLALNCRVEELIEVVKEENHQD